MSLKKKGLRCGKLKYLPKDGVFIVPFFMKSFKIQHNKIRLSIGKQFGDDRFLYFNLPEKLVSKKIKLIEIVPVYDGYRYKLNVCYDDVMEIKKNTNNSIENKISMDLGTINLITIYDPDGKQKIISGSIITTPNYYFNNKIDKCKEKLPHNRKSSKRIRNLLIKRENIINYRIDKIVNTLYSMYKTKTDIIIGYNEGWKQEVNLGRLTNRKFYGIPYEKIIKRIKYVFKESNVITIREPYTSKCDGLNLEDIRKKEKYDGRRIERGLFSSKTGKLLNADVNGAINIFRLYCKKNNIPYDKVYGNSICNPEKIKIEL